MPEIVRRSPPISMQRRRRLIPEAAVLRGIGAYGLLLLPLLLCAQAARGADDEVLARQEAAYRAEAAKTIVELQQFRRTEQGAGATLVNLNPAINRWFLLILDGPGGEKHAYHLQNPDPHGQQLHLAGPVLRLEAAGTAVDCPLPSAAGAAQLQAALRSGLAYAPLCDLHLYLRNHVAGRTAALKRVADLVRDHIWGGDEPARQIRQPVVAERGAVLGPGTGESPPADSPNPAQLRAPVPGERPVAPSTLGIVLDRPSANLAPGRWYPAAGVAGVHAGFVVPERVAPEGLVPGVVAAMEPGEAAASVYFIAYDLADFDLGFALGTSHPRVGWSDRPPAQVRTKFPGPDGFDQTAPLVTNGMVSPWLGPRTVSVFTAGFKREHGAFKYGELAGRNHGSHYGFVEDGTILSKLVPGLATLSVLDDGTIDMKTWSEADDALLPHLVDARQNGVPIIDYDPATGKSMPGAQVARWGPGNWSGTAEEKLRTVRAGLCLQETATRRFLIYGYFSSATPSTMARVFQAYRCRYAMLLDMNALEHTYLALYRRDAAGLQIEHLVDGMATLDPVTDKGAVPRFLEVPDDRDFFYLMRREPGR